MFVSVVLTNLFEELLKILLRLTVQRFSARSIRGRQLQADIRSFPIVRIGRIKPKRNIHRSRIIGSLNLLNKLLQVITLVLFVPSYQAIALSFFDWEIRRRPISSSLQNSLLVLFSSIFIYENARRY